MSDRDDRMCVLLPLGSGQRWAVPQACLAEILTLQADDGQPPSELSWRGLSVPVLDPGYDGELPWLDPRIGAGLVAVLLGEAGEGCDYWAVALRGAGLAVRRVLAEDCEDQPEQVLEDALAAFTLDEILYQVPDLTALHRRAAATVAA